MINVCQMIRRDSGWVNGPMVDSLRGQNCPYSIQMKKISED